MIGARQIGSRFLGAGRSVLKPPIALSGSFTGSATLTLTDLGSVTPLSGAVTCSATLTGALRSRLGLLASLDGLADMQGTVGARRALSGTVSATASLSAVLGAQKPISGTLEATAQADGSIHARIPLSGSLTARAIPFAIVGARRPLSCALSATATTTGTIVNGRPIAGAVAGIATLTMQLTPPFRGSDDSGRIIHVEPKFPVLVIPPKFPVIVFSTDDRSLSMQERTKQPSEVVDYVLDMREWFDEVDTDDYIVSGVVTVSPTGDPADLESGPGAFSPFATIDGAESQRARIWLGGGRDGVEYKVTTEVTTNEGRVEEIDLLVIVEEQ